MPVPWLEDGAALDPGAAARAALDLPAGPLRLVRATPTGPGHAFLEYETQTGEPVAAQWSDDLAALRRIGAETRASSGMPAEVVDAAGGGVLIQMRGADRELIGLAALLRRPGAQLVSHRAERRAVVRLVDGRETRYAKVYRPRRLSSALDRHRAIRDACGREFGTAPLLEVHPAQGLAVVGAIPGAPLHDQLARPGWEAGVRAAGHALRGLHRLPIAAGLGAHTAEAEYAVVESWAERVAPFRPDIGTQVRDRLHRMDLPPAGATVMIHRDFYDKQVILDVEHASMLDFDLLSAGDPALDAGNFLAHLDLRAAEGRLASTDAAAAAFLAGYGPASGNERVASYRRLACLRLACVYAVRPSPRSVVAAMLGPAGPAQSA